jgi:shikimate 5-dehydrogenase
LKPGYINFLGILGKDIGYSLSPLIHNKSIELLGRSETYLTFDGDPPNWRETLDALWDLGCIGLSVTTPFKSVIAQVTSSKLPAVNTVYRGKNSWLSCSTDGIGLERALKRAGHRLSDFSRIVLMGGGGASLSLVHYFATHDDCPGTMTILRRGTTNDRAFTDLSGPGISIDLKDFTPASLEESLRKENVLLVQATNAMSRGDDLKEFVPGLRGLDGYYFDLVYARSPCLLAEAHKAGIPCQDGLVMLVEQALASQTYWWGESAEFDSVLDLVKRSLA